MNRRHGALQNLLSRPDSTLIDAINKALAAAARAFPIPRAHRADLPFAVRDLSRMLTAERTSLNQPYWSAPRYLSAYLHYFLPWNLFRLSWLIPSLDLPLQSGATILDLGSGPLTLPIALWCCRPDLRGVPLNFICTDVATKPMETGRDILQALAGKNSPWRIRLVRAPLEKALGAASGEKGAGLDCILAGNVLNELPVARNMSLEQRLESIMGLAFRKLAPEGRMLLVEPGTRLGGKMIALSRKGALHQGFSPLAPCPHSGPCPMIEQPLHYAASPDYTGWCHFIHPADSAPAVLTDLGKKAHLEKDSLAISCLFLERPAGDAAHNAGQGRAVAEKSAARNASFQNDEDGAMLSANRHNDADDDLDALEALYNEIMAEDSLPASNQRGSSPSSSPARQSAQGHDSPEARPAPAIEQPSSPYGVVRVISDLIRLPDEAEPARYSCCAKGLALLADAVRVPSGGAVSIRWPAHEERDQKTGALILRREPTRERSGVSGGAPSGAGKGDMFKGKGRKMPPAGRVR